MPDLLDRLKTALADRYAIEREIGAGGMATVYLAEDLKQGRQVAVKVLRPELAAVVGPERFLREIEISANLNHPHILPLFDSGEADGFLYYVMPFVEGESLRDKLQREKQFSIEDALAITQDVASAMAYAHTQGVIHRDLKPGNILLHEGEAMVADFGLALALRAAGGRRLTETGLSLGTPEYMSPEQATADHDVDARSDIYSLGAVLYELLAGEPPHTGRSTQAIIAKLLTEQPTSLRILRNTVPEAVDRAVMKALAKVPADRFATAAQLSDALAAPGPAAATAAPNLNIPAPTGGITPTDTAPIQATAPAGRRQISTVAISVAALVLVAGAAGIVLMNREPATITLGHTAQLTFDPGLELDPAISPDGNMVAYAAGPWGSVHIHLRQVIGGRAIDLTDGLPGDHRWPQWSPDGTQIMFSAAPSIYVIQQLGGTPKRLVENGLSPAWSPDGREIVYAVDSTIYVQSVESGDTRSIGNDFTPHSFQWSRDGSRIAYVSGNAAYVLSSTVLANIAPTTLKTITTTNPIQSELSEEVYLYVSPVWLPDNRQLLYVSNEGGSRDIYQLSVSASGGRAADPQRLTTGLNVFTMSLSADGTTLAYSVFRYDANIWSIRIPDRGTISIAEAQPVTLGSQAIEGIGVSPDGRWLGFDSNRSGNQDIYRVALPDGEPEQLTTNPADDFVPSWSPDGQEIAFYSFRHGNRDLHLMNPDGSSLQRITDHPAQERLPDWSPDGNQLVFDSDKSGRYELYIISRDDSSSDWGTPRQLTFDGGGEQPRWSPDGRWIAYIQAIRGLDFPSVAIGNQTLRIVSPERHDPRTLVASEAGSGDPVPVFPEWSPDGQTVYYKARDAQGTASFWAVPVSGGTPRMLVRFDDPSKPSTFRVFTTDGDRFFFTIDRRESDIWVMELIPPN